jgi:hypothetical protein
MQRVGSLCAPMDTVEYESPRQGSHKGAVKKAYGGRIVFVRSRAVCSVSPWWLCYDVSLTPQLPPTVWRRTGAAMAVSKAPGRRWHNGVKGS